MNSIAVGANLKARIGGASEDPSKSLGKGGKIAQRKPRNSFKKNKSTEFQKSRETLFQGITYWREKIRAFLAKCLESHVNV